MKIAFYGLRAFDELDYAQKFSKQYGIDFTWTSENPNPQNLDCAKGCDAVCTIPCEMGEPYLRAFAAMGVKYLPCRSIGYDHIDLACAKKLGLRVSNASYPPHGVANYAIMLMLMCTRKINNIMLRAAAQDYSLKGKMGHDISDCTIGVIGTGRIGATVIEHLSGFGCKLLAYDVYQNKAVEKWAQYTDLDSLYANSDIITLHTNATPQNHHMIDSAALAKMKDGVILINTARGTLIDPDALIDGLESGKIGAAGLDVIEDEFGLYYFDLSDTVLKNRELAMLRSFPNVVVTPHTAFYTDVNVSSMVQGAFEAVRCFASGEEVPGEITL